MDFQNHVREWSSTLRLPLMRDARGNNEHVTWLRAFFRLIRDRSASPLSFFSGLPVNQPHTCAQGRAATPHKDDIGPVIVYFSRPHNPARENNELVRVFVAYRQFTKEFPRSCSDRCKCRIDRISGDAHDCTRAILCMNHCPRRQKDKSKQGFQRHVSHRDKRKYGVWPNACDYAANEPYKKRAARAHINRLRASASVRRAPRRCNSGPGSTVD